MKDVVEPRDVATKIGYSLQSENSSTAPPQVCPLCGHEFGGVKVGQSVGSYQAVLTAANERGMQQRKVKLAANAGVGIGTARS